MSTPMERWGHFAKAAKFMEKLKILVVEDDKLAQRVMAKHLTGHVVEIVETKKDALKSLDTERYEICFLDLMLGKNDDCSGLALIPVAVSKGAYVVVMSSLDSEEIVHKAYKLGCHDFYVKGNEEANISAVLARYKKKNAGTDLKRVFSEKFITNDPQTKADILEVLKYASSNLPVLILGQSGVGKTLLAKLIHEFSGRTGAFVDINCAAYNEDLLEAELFGYKKGAFTGAYETHKGKLLMADKGTLFLDEIGAMSHKMQTKLLKAIEEKSFYPVGSDKKEHSDFRIISATLENLQKLLIQEKLRFDFFQRINGFVINLKPLSERKCDIFTLINAFTKTGRKLSFEPHAKTLILNYIWPGNIRELKKFVEVAQETQGTITPEVIRKHITDTMTTLPRTEKVYVPTEIDSSCIDRTPKEDFLTNQQYEYSVNKGLNESIAKFAYEVIKCSLSRHGGKRANTLKELKISKRMLYSILYKFEGRKNGIKT